jgi:hypothetical protein
VGAGAVRWVCARCDVSVGRLDGEQTKLPATWTQSEGSAYCLGCSRALAGEVAMDSAPDSISREDRVRLRRDAVIEFEIVRAPEAPNRTIAHSCRTSATAVLAVRKSLESAAGAPHQNVSGGV